MPDSHLHTDSTELVSHLKELTTALTAVHEDLYWLAMQSPNAMKDPQFLLLNSTWICSPN